ncbi:hypothetical protein [Benzoatithermus flavus]|uniref:Uncharacterized protein n=1 Tax=Benzoatithermus flavus TaxID=3108223 RepID=A0ABU8XX52_9PROT
MGFLASVLSIIGVPGAVWQAWRARSAAQAAEAASRDALSKLTTLRTMTQLSAVLQQLEELKAFNRLRAASQAIERYSRLRSSLVEIRARDHALNDEERGVLQQTIAILAQLERELDRARERGGGEIGFADANARLSDELDRLSELLASLERRSLRTDHGR